MVPNGWSLIKLKDIGKCITGLTYSPKNVVDKGLLVLRSSNVQDSKLSFNDNVYVDLEVDNKSKTRLGDILLCVRNGSKKLIGKSAFIDKGNEQLAHGAFMSLFRSNETPDYTFQLFQSSKFFRQVNQNLGATINSINSGNLYQFKFVYPPFEERKKIAKILSTWDKAISTTERLIDNSKQQKKSLMQQLLTGKKRLLDDSGRPFEGDWVEGKLADVVEFNNGKGHEKHIVEDGKYIVVNSKYISSDGLVKKTTDSAFCLANVGDVLMVMSDVPNGKAIAKCLYVDASEKFTVNQRVARFRPKSINSIFLYYTLNRNSYYLQFDDGVKQTNLRKDEVLDCPVFRPNDEEQQKIASVLNNAGQEIELLQQQLADLKQEKKALMQQLLTGKRRVIVDEKEVA